MKWLRELLGMCSHKWEVYKEAKVVSDWGASYTRIYLKCSHCGDFKIVNGG